MQPTPGTTMHFDYANFASSKQQAALRDLQNRAIEVDSHQIVTNSLCQRNHSTPSVKLVERSAWQGYGQNSDGTINAYVNAGNGNENKCESCVRGSYEPLDQFPDQKSFSWNSERFPFDNNNEPSLLGLINSGVIASVATDEAGSRFVQDQFPITDPGLRRLIYEYLIEKGGFDWLSYDAHGNFVIQKVVEEARGLEQLLISEHMANRIVKMCFNRYGSRIVQKVFEKFEFGIKSGLLRKFIGSECLLAVDHNATHVIQKLFMHFPPTKYGFIVEAITHSRENFKNMVENKYGCRVIQSAMEKLENASYLPSFNGVDSEFEKNFAQRLLNRMLKRLLEDCSTFVSHHFANYVVQHVIQSELHIREREQILHNNILRNVLSLSQEKFASHVVEQALKYASPSTLCMIMDEVFDGYIPNERGNDALDIMLFDAYGNYVVQAMLNIAIDVRNGLRKGEQSWLVRLTERVLHHEQKLRRYSSGKKIIEKIRSISN